MQAMYKVHICSLVRLLFQAQRHCECTSQWNSAESCKGYFGQPSVFPWHTQCFPQCYALATYCQVCFRTVPVFSVNLFSKLNITSNNGDFTIALKLHKIPTVCCYIVRLVTNKKQLYSQVTQTTVVKTLQ